MNSKKRDFKTIKCRAVVPAKYEVCLMLSSVCSEERKTISVTAEKNECIHTENLFTGTNSEILEWLCKISIKELSQKADKALYNCSHFYYP